MKFLNLAFSITLFLSLAINSISFGQSFCECPTSTNQLSNPHFDGGTSGFYSDLPNETGCGIGEYDIGHEGRDKCNSIFWYDDIWDHTLGTSEGNYMIIDGPFNETDYPPNRVWGANTIVELGETYTFCFWVMPKLSNVNSTDLKLAFYMNGDNISGNISIPNVTTWINYTFLWTATYSGIASPQIRQVENFAGYGYEYGLDDIYFGICEEEAPPCDVTANWTYDVSSNDCLVSFTNLSTAGTGTTIVGYHWDFGDGSSSDLENPTHYFDEPGSYPVCLMVYGVNEDGECCISNYCTMVIITCELLPCEANIYNIIYSINDAGECIVQFSASATPNRDVIGWYWNFGDGETGTGQYPMHDYASNGTYNVCVTTILDDGEDCCSETFCSEVPIDCTGFPDTYVAPDNAPILETPLERTASEALIIFPNPAQDWVEFQFEASEAQDYKIQLFDSQGKLLITKQLSAEKGINKNQLDLQQLSNGSYFVYIQLKDRRLTQKILVNF